MPDSSEHTPTVAIRMPNGALGSLAGNVDPHHEVAIADLVLVQSAVQETVEKLSGFLIFISTILPDISKYAAVEDIERGVSIPWVKMKDALLVTFGFGLPLVLLSYVFLKNKEVAP
jgi:hypothetical protein